MRPEDVHKALIHRWIDEVGNQAHFDVMDEICHPDFQIVQSGLDSEPLRGADGFKIQLRRFRESFPDLHHRIIGLVAEGDRVAVRVEANGTLMNPVLGLPATGKHATFWVDHFCIFKDDLWLESRVTFDRLYWMHQLGLIEDPLASRVVPAELLHAANTPTF